MALKKSRPITVRDLPFRWKFKAHKDDLTRYGASPRYAHIAIQEAVEGHPGRPMVAQVESTVFVSYEAHDGDTGHIRHKARFTPVDVRKLIETALDAGWDPTAKQQYEAPEGIELTDYKTR